MQGRHLKIKLRVSAITFRLFQVTLLAKASTNSSGIELVRSGFETRTKNLSFCRQVLMSSRQLQRRSLTTAKCRQMKNARRKRANYWFYFQNMCIYDVVVAAFLVCRLLLTWHAIEPPLSMLDVGSEREKLFFLFET